LAPLFPSVIQLIQDQPCWPFIVDQTQARVSGTGMSNSVPLGGSSAYNSYNAAAFAAQFAAKTGAAAASKPKAPQQPKPPKQQQVVDDEDEIADDVAEYDNFANVSTANLETLGLIEHPSPACEAASLSSVPSPDCDYTVKLPSKVLQSEFEWLLIGI
jgi:hypothetical protein